MFKSYDPNLKGKEGFFALLTPWMEQRGFVLIKSKNAYVKEFELGEFICDFSFIARYQTVSDIGYGIWLKDIDKFVERSEKGNEKYLDPADAKHLKSQKSSKFPQLYTALHNDEKYSGSSLDGKIVEDGKSTAETVELFKKIYEKHIVRFFKNFESYEQIDHYVNSDAHYLDYCSHLVGRVYLGLTIAKSFDIGRFEDLKMRYTPLMDQQFGKNTAPYYKIEMYQDFLEFLQTEDINLA